MLEADIQRPVEDCGSFQCEEEEGDEDPEDDFCGDDQLKTPHPGRVRLHR